MRIIDSIKSKLRSFWHAYLKPVDDRFGGVTARALRVIFRQERLLTARIAKLSFELRKIRYVPSEKIRLVFLFHMPSMWPAVEGVWERLANDARFEAKMLLYDGPARDSVQMKGAREFLTEQGVQFSDADSFDIDDFRPHVFFYQTPWDESHRPERLRSDAMANKGYRTVYIPYGIEYSMSGRRDCIFSDLQFKAKPWRMYTLSEKALMDHRDMCPRGADNIVATGYPRYDALVNRIRSFPLDSGGKEVGVRKRVLLNMHFPDKVSSAIPPVPPIGEYLDFLRSLDNYSDLFFVVRPHPKFYQMYERYGCASEANELNAHVMEADNAYLDLTADYRPALFNADFMISDRSALLVEAAARDIPILYMTNVYNMERILPSVAPLFEACYQGNTSYDIRRFLEMVVLGGMDYKREARQSARGDCLPYLDGKCAERIVEDLASAVMQKGA